MAGLGKCPCCKQEKNLTNHHVKERNNKRILICNDCHIVIGEYQKYINTNLT